MFKREKKFSNGGEGPIKVFIVKAKAFPVVMYGSES